MSRTIEQVRVTLAGDGFYPQAFRWAGRNIRVLLVEGVRTSGAQRRFRVRTVEGIYELIQHTAAQMWELRRRPSWWERVIGQGAHSPRYSPAPGRGRVSRAEARAREQRVAAVLHSGDGGRNASRFAVVR